MQKLMFITIVSVAFFSCNSTDVYNNLCVLNTSTLSGTYQIVSEKIQSSPSATPVENISNWTPCERDNLYDLAQQGTFSFTEGANSCTNPPFSRNGNWQLQGDTLVLNFTGGNTERIVVSGFNCYSFDAINRDPVTGEIRTIKYEKQ